VSWRRFCAELYPHIRNLRLIYTSETEADFALTQATIKNKIFPKNEGLFYYDQSYEMGSLGAKK
jgi:hypothetical protein